jgi:glycosyltransferase involved in cell wall biosynthesis
MGDFQSITVLINTHNEEKNLEECISSARQLTKKILVIDMQSSDRTPAIAHEQGVPLKLFPYQHYVEPARNFALKQAETEWAFILDADERITPELAEEIKKCTEDKTYSHYKVPRKEMFARKIWLKHGGWWPNHQLRLIKLADFKDWPERIHSTPEINGEMGYVNNAILHYSKNDYTEVVNKTITFENIESDLLYKADRPVNTFTFYRKFAGELYRRLIKQQGYKDGRIGIIESVYQAYSKTITYLYLYEKKKSSSV